MSAPIISVENISFAYHNFEVLFDVSLEVRAGEVFCLLGPNGSGKTTLLDCLLGLHHPGSGRISINGNSISKMQVAEIARSIAYIPQSHQKNFPFTVRDVILMGRTAYTGFFDSPDDEDRRITDEVITDIGIEHLKHRDYTHLSGGESQLVMIGRALAQEASLLIMDEPASHLDFRNEMLLLETIIKIIKDGGRSVILTTHSPYLAFFLENRNIPVRAGLLDKGCLIETGTPSMVLNTSNIEKVFGVKAAMIDHSEDGNLLKSLIPIKSIQENYSE